MGFGGHYQGCLQNWAWTDSFCRHHFDDEFSVKGGHFAPFEALESEGVGASQILETVDDPEEEGPKEGHLDEEQFAPDPFH